MLRTYREHQVPKSHKFGVDEKTNQPSSFKAVPSEEFARQLTLLDSELFRHVDAREFNRGGWKKKDPNLAPTIKEMIRRFNQTSMWACYSVIAPKTLPERVAAWDRLMLTCAHLEAMQNYSTVHAIWSGLMKNESFRLKATKAKLSKSTKAQMERYGEFFSNSKNYKAQRDRNGCVNPPSVPHIGVFTQDLLAVDDMDTWKDRETRVLNWGKFVMYGQIVFRIHTMQKYRYSFHPIPALQDYIINTIYNTVHESEPSELYRMSRAREDKHGKVKKVVDEPKRVVEPSETSVTEEPSRSNTSTGVAEAPTLITPGAEKPNILEA